MTAEDAIAEAERHARLLGHAHAVIDVGGGLRVVPVLDALGFHILELVRP